jgi:cytochrome P450
MDDPEHTRLHGMVTAAFAIKRVESLRPAIQRIVDGLIDEMLAGPAPVDLVEAFALPVPPLVICELLGVPYADHDLFQANGKILINGTSTPEQASAAAELLRDYVDRLVGEKLAHPGDDPLTELPDQLAELRATDDPKMIAATVEELLSYLSIVHTGRGRVALEDIEIADQTIRAGEGVILALDIGNRDEAVFADPYRLDLHRDARQHQVFSFGVHQWLGQPLARVELQVVYGMLYRGIPTLRLAVDLDQIPFKHDGAVYGVYELPVAW